MPKVRVRDIDLYYEIHGTGYPLVLIRGLGSNADHWYVQVPAFSKKYRLVIFDNRGVGRSDKPDIPYTMSMMAADTVGLMEALRIPKAHILGISMGGMIAQVIAIHYPERVNGLILSCTHCGGTRVVPPSNEVGRIFGELVLTGSEEANQKALECLFTERTLREKPELAQRYQEVSKKFPPSPKFLIHQWEAVRDHDSWEDLIKIQAPTLVITGSDDVLVPPMNSTVLAERIPNARLEIIQSGGHQFLVERAEAFNQAVLKFLSSLS